MKRNSEQGPGVGRVRKQVLRTGVAALATLAAAAPAVPASAKERSKYIPTDTIEQRVVKRLFSRLWQPSLDGAITRRVPQHTGGREFPGEPSTSDGGRGYPDNQAELYENINRPLIADRRRRKEGQLDIDSRDAAYGWIDQETGQITFMPFNPKTMAYDGVIRLIRFPKDIERVDFFTEPETRDPRGRAMPYLDHAGAPVVIGQRSVSTQPLVTPVGGRGR